MPDAHYPGSRGPNAEIERETAKAKTPLSGTRVDAHVQFVYCVVIFVGFVDSKE